MSGSPLRCAFSQADLSPVSRCKTAPPKLDQGHGDARLNDFCLSALWVRNRRLRWGIDRKSQDIGLRGSPEGHRAKPQPISKRRTPIQLLGMLQTANRVTIAPETHPSGKRMERRTGLPGKNSPNARKGKLEPRARGSQTAFQTLLVNTPGVSTLRC